MVPSTITSCETRCEEVEGAWDCFGDVAIFTASTNFSTWIASTSEIMYHMAH